jgi:peroxiredoxin
MKRGKMIAGATGLLVVAAAVLVWFIPRSPDTVPDLAVVTVDGEQLEFASLQGKPVLVTFWATSCRTCVNEIPNLIDLYRELSPQGLEIVAISMDYDPPNRVLAMRETHDIPYTVALDIHADAARAFGNVRLTPTAFLIAPDGRIVYRNTGALPFERLRRDIVNMLDQSARENMHKKTGLQTSIQDSQPELSGPSAAGLQLSGVRHTGMYSQRVTTANADCVMYTPAIRTTQS